MNFRVVRNTARIGKPWRVVVGYYAPYATWKEAGVKRWKTTQVVSEHATKLEAETSAEFWREMNQ